MENGKKVSSRKLENGSDEWLNAVVDMGVHGYINLSSAVAMLAPHKERLSLNKQDKNQGTKKTDTTNGS